MKKTIPEIMLRDHARIHNLLSEIDFNLQNNKNIEESYHLFIRLKWTVEKHFFVEEKVIFTIYASSELEELQNFDNLIKEHREVLFLLKKIDDNFQNSHELFQKTKKLLSEHAKFEDEIFYPRLEEELTKEQKLLIYDRCEKWV